MNVRLRCSGSKPDAAPDGAKRVLFDRSYKDFAPTELGRDIAKCSTCPEHVAEIIIY